jgi:hypothetical protein
MGFCSQIFRIGEFPHKLLLFNAVNINLVTFSNYFDTEQLKVYFWDFFFYRSEKKIERSVSIYQKIRFSWVTYKISQSWYEVLIVEI